MTGRKQWIVTLSAIFAGIVIAIVQNKVVPCLGTLQEAFSISMSTAGWLSSIFCIMSIIVAFPAAVITNRLGVKKTCFYSLVCAGIGSVIGLFSNSVWMLMLSRIVEGIGAGLISIAVPSIIAMWFPPEKRGLPTGIWSSWQFVAQALCFFFGGMLITHFGWHGIWVSGLVLIFAAAALCILLVSAPAPEESFSEASSAENVSILEGLKGPFVWTASIAMFCFCFACFGFVTWAAACWSETTGIDINLANQYVSLFAIISLPVVIVVGLILDRVDHHKFCVASCFGYIFAVSAAFLLPGASFILPFVIIYPFFEGAVSTCLWAMIPQTVEDSRYTSVAVALFTLFSNVGMLVGPPVVGLVIEHMGWKMAVLPLAAIMAMGTLMAFATKEYK